MPTLVDTRLAPFAPRFVIVRADRCVELAQRGGSISLFANAGSRTRVLRRTPQNIQPVLRQATTEPWPDPHAATHAYLHGEHQFRNRKSDRRKPSPARAP